MISQKLSDEDSQPSMNQLIEAAKNRLQQQQKTFVSFACRLCGCNYYHPIGPRTNVLYTCDNCGVVFTDPKKFTDTTAKDQGEQAA